jgi:beta-glucosidase
LKATVGNSVTIHFAQGYEKTSEEIWGKGLVFTSDPEREKQLIQEAVETARKSDVAIIFGGLNHDFDTEGIDRPDMKLPYTQNELIEAVQKANPNTVVVLIAGSPVEVHEWIDQIPAVVMAWYAGMEGGHALADVLFGKVNPSGKLPFTFPVRLEDSPAHKLGDYPGENLTVTYNEGIFVGYRYFDSENLDPQFCFGHGLSYSDFAYSDLEVANQIGAKNFPVNVRLKIKNTGQSDGSEVVQLYVNDENSSLNRPAKELKAFKKIFLKAGKEKEVVFALTEEAFSFYDPANGRWNMEPGMFNILVGSSSRDIRLTGTLKINGQ